MLNVLVFLQNYLAGPLRRNDRVATAVEYGLIVVLIAVAIIAALTALGGSLSTLFQTIATSIGTAAQKI